MLIFTLFTLSGYEEGIYQQIVKNTVKSEMSSEQRALKLMQLTHEFLKPRLDLFDGEKRINLRDTVFRSSDVELIDGRGGCGSYAHVLARLLQVAGIDARIGQMKCGKIWGCHIVVEADINQKFVVLDATYNIAFRKKDGTLANFREVGDNWEYFKLQVPKGYYDGYNYEDVRYTNWDKIPVIMPILRKITKMIIGDKVETLSIRGLVLNTYKAYMIALIGFYFLLLVFSIFWINKKVSGNISTDKKIV
jgi:hypothetical protein